jgi:hypothetical protein
MCVALSHLVVNPEDVRVRLGHYGYQTTTETYGGILPLVPAAGGRRRRLGRHYGRL